MYIDIIYITHLVVKRMIVQQQHSPWLASLAPSPPPSTPLGIIKGYGVILIWDLNMIKFQTAITRHHWP